MMITNQGEKTHSAGKGKVRLGWISPALHGSSERWF
jgi:hypothetical protein